MILLNDIKNIAENPRGCHLSDAEDRLYLRSISYAIRGTNAVQNLTKQGLTDITAC